jgi:hypothetical protein
MPPWMYLGRVGLPPFHMMQTKSENQSIGRLKVIVEHLQRALLFGPPRLATMSMHITRKSSILP